MRVLLIEPDTLTSDSIALMLRAEGFQVEASDLAEDLVGLAEHYAFDAIVMSLETADLPGLVALRGLRRAGNRTPLVALSRGGDFDSEVAALNAGADDFMRKPFHRDVLVSRTNALIRRSAGKADPVLTIGRLAVHTLEKRVRIDGKALHLTGKEYLLVETMALRSGSTFSKEALMTQLYGGRDEPELKIIDVFVCKVRNKLRPFGIDNVIETVWGRGYRLVAAPSEDERTYIPRRDPSALTMKGRVLARLEQGAATFADLHAACSAWSIQSLRATVSVLLSAQAIVNVGRPGAALYVRARQDAEAA